MKKKKKNEEKKVKTFDDQNNCGLAVRTTKFSLRGWVQYAAIENSYDIKRMMALIWRENV